MFHPGSFWAGAALGGLLTLAFCTWAIGVRDGTWWALYDTVMYMLDPLLARIDRLRGRAPIPQAVTEDEPAPPRVPEGPPPPRPPAVTAYVPDERWRPPKVVAGRPTLL